MNRTFRTQWNPARGAVVVTDEAKPALGRAKRTVAVAVAAALAGILSAGTALAYEEAGEVGVGKEKTWESVEYQKDWGLAAMNASSAYALGFSGKGVAVGVMDSGALLEKHPELKGERFHAVKVEGQSYGSEGDRYPQSSRDKGHNAPTGSTLPVDGNWQAFMNDDHGTHVTGTVGANRDGSEFHGVAWGADVYVGNTGGSDDTNYGPFQDPQFFHQGWSALADAVSDANRFEDGETRGGFINNSFGTNMRVVKNDSRGKDGGDTSVHFKVDTVSQAEYEYFLFQKDSAGRKNADHRWNGKSFVDAAFEAVKDKKVVQIFTTGNRDFAQPYYRPLYPYFNPEAERHWIAVAGAQDGGITYGLYTQFNEAGNAKWWTVVAPAKSIYSSTTNSSGDPGYASKSGTSMAAPHVAGVMAVLMERYDQMDALQVRDVMLTTASHKKSGWNYMDWTAKEGEVDPRLGWGMPDLKKGMYGPGQLLGVFEYNLRGESLDVWSNDISETALNQREREDKAWLAAAEKWMANPTVTLGDGFSAEEKALLGDVMLTSTDIIVGLEGDKAKVKEEDAIAWRKAYYEKRIAAIKARPYDGSLVKKGTGTLVLTGSNTFEGGTTVEEGTLLGFTESFGEKPVVVKGGSFGIIKTYDDKLTLKGVLKSSEARKANVVVEPAGLYLVPKGDEVSVASLTFKPGAAVALEGVDMTDKAVLAELWSGKTSYKGSVSAEKIEGTPLGDGLAFFSTDVEVKDNKLTASMAKRAGGMTAAAKTPNASRVARAVESVPKSEAFNAMLPATHAEAEATFSSIGSDVVFSAENLAILQSMAVIDAAKSNGQGASGLAGAKTAELENGVRLWAAGIGRWSELDAGEASSRMKADHHAGLFGGEFDVSPVLTLGAYVGAGKSDYRTDAAGKLDADDLHVGLFGKSAAGDVKAAYGLSWTHQDRDLSRSVTFMKESGFAKSATDAEVLALWAEASWTGLTNDRYALEPFVGLTWLRTSADGFSEKAGTYAFKTEVDNRNLQVSSLGVRGSLPLTTGPVAVKLSGEAAWMHFFGDAEGSASMRIADAGVAKLKGEKMGDMAAVKFGAEAQITPAATFGVSYGGAYGSDVKSHGVGVSFRYAF